VPCFNAFLAIGMVDMGSSMMRAKFVDPSRVAFKTMAAVKTQSTKEIRGNSSKHFATERRSINEILEKLPEKKKWAETVFSRLKRIAAIPDKALILDVGAASGDFLIVCIRLGYQCEGIEPWEEARANAAKVSDILGIPFQCIDGLAESIPYNDNTFDVVHASSVIEHVLDVEKAFAEIFRVLKQGGVFWFNAASSLCPLQDEIQGFPLFGWYPDPLKRKIMNWAKDEKPHLIGHTMTPAINWFTPSKARKLLQKHGFQRIYDRWDLRAEDEGGEVYKLCLRVIRSTNFSRALADIMVPGCSYAAIKDMKLFGSIDIPHQGVHFFWQGSNMEIARTYPAMNSYSHM
jgi:ubiquinone/menaquinone biosynthesis C-methylase UbiE